MRLPHTAENLATILETVLERFELNHNVISAVSDGAANILKGLKNLQGKNIARETVKCSCNTLHLCVTEALSSHEIRSIINKVKNIVNEVRRSTGLMEALAKSQSNNHNLQSTETVHLEVEQNEPEFEEGITGDEEVEEYVNGVQFQPL